MLVLIVAFILSGAAGLIYESIWSRYLGLFVGHSAYAQLIVLVIFLGGMSLGAWLIGERSTRIRHPLRAYALVELVAGLLGLAFHGIFLGTTGVAYDHLFPALAGGPGVAVIKWTLAALLILPQSILLGMTFPLMTAGAIRLASRAPGQTLSLMYFANSLGAALGVLLAGFVLIEWGGLPGTLDVAGGVNLLVALIIYVGGRVLGWDAAFGVAPGSPASASVAGAPAVAAPSNAASPQAPAPVTPAGVLATDDGRIGRLLMIVAFGTAVASFIYEIAWIRMLSLVLGSATHSFELMLSAFILGLALGALLVRRHADRFRHPVRALGIVQIAMGTLALATLPVYIWTFGWTVALQDALAQTDGGYRIYAIARYALCVIVMFPATVCAGMTLPLITRTLYMSGSGERAIGRVYSINTLGSILGVALAGVVLMPVLGLKWLLVVGGLADVVLGVALLAWAWERTPFRNPALARGALVATGGLIFVIVTMTRFDPAVLSSGVFRRRAMPERGAFTILHHVDGRTATVTMKKPREGTYYTLATNGKPDASIGSEWLNAPAAGAPPISLAGDMATQVLLALSTLAHAPEARTAAVIGQGSGVTSHFMLASPVLDHLATIEIESEMIEASKHFRPMNERVFSDPRARFVVDDAKSYFAAGQRRYDVILSEPSNPWVSGVSGLFTDEFYRRVRTHLTDDGVLGQWLHLYEIDDQLVLSVLAAIDRNFDDYALYSTGGLDILVVAKARGQLRDPDWNAVAAWPRVRSDLARAVPLTAESLGRALIATRATLHPMLSVDVEPNSDYTPVLDLGAERTRYLKHRAQGIISLGSDRFDLHRALTGAPAGFGTSVAPSFQATRVTGLARGAALRAWRTGASPADSTDDQAARARQVLALLDASLASPRPPESWRSWLEMVLTAEASLHLGTAGVADEAFWRPVLAHAEKHRAPAGARAALQFLHGIAAWDWPGVIAAAPVLAAAQRANQPWVEPGVLRDGVVTAYLRQGNPAEARRWLGMLTLPNRTADPAYTLRTRLMYWYIAQASGQLEPRPGAE
ncbi:MAG TPA: fused MFS/spermidine synthase [Gemmatimonadaceae bacterium]|nr:fused MFS/spermidine synthase [Gemmatimonadaceae bacterium]